MDGKADAAESQGLELGRLIDEAKISLFQWRVIAYCSLGSFIAGYAIQSLSLAVPRLAEEFGLPPSDFAAAFSATLFGVAVGSMGVAPFADRIGRRPMAIGLMALIGLSSIGAMSVSGMSMLTLWRFLAGVGLGGYLPVAIAMTSEYSPARRRVAMITTMVCAMGVGSLAAGFIASPLDAVWGWRAVIGAGGAALLVSALMAAVFPESLQMLVRRGAPESVIQPQIARIAPAHAGARLFIAARDKAPSRSVLALFAPEYRARTALIWAVFVLNQFVAYGLASWVPTILRSAGWTQPQAMQGASFIPLGGLAGALLISTLADKGKGVLALAAAYAACGAVLVAFGNTPNSVLIWSAFLAVAGLGVMGTQMSLGSMTATFYPPDIRSTAVGWASGVGRIGAIVSPLLVGIMLQAKMDAETILAWLSIPALICAGGILLLPRALSGKR
jgi:AAHS family 4-hydroxybenzoate transporter-like MFS transporter